MAASKEKGGLRKKEDVESRLALIIAEFEKLKDEQSNRIGFRDNIIYATLAAVGTVFSYALAVGEHLETLLLIPWVCFVLGWAYISNDQKISAIGVYIEGTLTTLTRKLLKAPADEPVLPWETEHRGDVRRTRRKGFQLLADFVTFVASGIVALVYFYLKKPIRSCGDDVLILVDSLMLLVIVYLLLTQFIADMARREA